MSMGRFLTTTLATAVVLFIVGGGIWGFALTGFLENQTIGPDGFMKAMEDTSMLHIALSNVLYAAFLTLVVGSWAGRRSFASGFTAGLTIGLLTAFSMAIMFIGTMNWFSPTGHFVDALFGAVWAGIGGGVVAVMLARGEAAA